MQSLFGQFSAFASHDFSLQCKEEICGCLRNDKVLHVSCGLLYQRSEDPRLFDLVQPYFFYLFICCVTHVYSVLISMWTV